MVIPLMACEYDAISKARSLVKREREREIWKNLIGIRKG